MDRTCDFCRHKKDFNISRRCDGCRMMLDIGGNAFMTLFEPGELTLTATVLPPSPCLTASITLPGPIVVGATETLDIDLEIDEQGQVIVTKAEVIR